MPHVTARFASLPPYLLATIPQRKRELIAKGVDVIDLGAGDADLSPFYSPLLYGDSPTRYSAHHHRGGRRSCRTPRHS